MEQTRTIMSRYDSPSFVKTEQSLFTNYGTLETGVSQPKGESYLIITFTDFVNEIQPLADWKGTQGFDVTITTTTEIPGGATKENIHTYIQSAYDTWTDPPAYVLLVGDVAQIPTFTGSASGSCTDLNYVCVNGTDYFADIYLGRLPAATTDQVTAMVDKIVYFETGNYEDDSWVMKGAYTGSDDPTYWSVAEGTQNYVIDTFLTPAGFTCDKLYAHTYGATTAQVIAAIDNGRSLVCYTGHGSTTSWAGPGLSQSQVNALTNDNMYNFVASHACLTNQFTVSECFGETWMRAPHKGAYAYWGASESSYWDEDDLLERYMYQQWFTNDVDFLCGMTNAALLDLYAHYSGGGMVQYYFQIYNLLGDPAAKPWKSEPNPNLPPAVPLAPSGPTQGVTFLTYSFSAIATADPEGLKVLLKFDFGDGNTSEFYGPFTPGQTATTTHTWMQAGTYNVRVMAMDENGSQSKWSDPHAITINEKPKLNITSVKGGIGFRVTVENTVDQALQIIPWSVEPKVALPLAAMGMYGTIVSLAAGDETTVKTGLLAGFGPMTYTVKVGDATMTGSGFVLGIFVIGLK